MKGTNREGIDVYDFVDDAETEQCTTVYSRRFLNPNKVKEISPLDKYKFLEVFSRGTSASDEEIRNGECVEVDAGDSDHKHKIHDPTLGSSKEDCAATIVISGLDELPFEKRSPIKLKNNDPSECLIVNSLAMDALSLGVPSTQSKQLNCANPDLSSDNDSVDVISDNESAEQSSSSTFSSDIKENQGSIEDSAFEHLSRGWEREEVNMAIDINPDYLIYKDRYCTDSSLTFCCGSVKLEGTNSYDGKESFSFEWPIDEITSVESLWFIRIETALVKICARQMNINEAEDRDAASGAVELKFAVSDRCWPDIHEGIMSIDARYRAIWKFSHGTDERDDESFFEKNKICRSKRYFSSFSEHFEDVIYPKGDPDAVSISKSDVELLRPETFINDTVIDFYIKYLETKIRTEDKHRFHFFNSFFFRKLADLDKTPSSASEGRAAFQRVRKWTRKVNLFEKDYIFIPVNFNLHWSLLVICHPGEVANFQDEETEGFPKVPCILHMDSIKGSHKGLKNLVQSYLWEEWKERHAESSEDVSKKFLNLRFISLELPQQENSYDCGLFLLHYVELFLEDAPVHFSPFKITKFSNFLGIDWFQPAEASLKRALIQRLIYKLLQDDTQKIPPTDCDEEYQCPRSNENCDGRENMELHSEINRPQNSWHGSSMPFTADEEIERKLLPISPGNAQHMGSSEFIFKDLFEPGTSNGSFPNGQFRAFERTIPYQKFKGMSPVEEDEETGEQFVFSLNVGNSPPIAEFTSPHAHKSGTPHHSKKFGSFDASWNPDFSVIQEEEGNGASSSETSTSGSQTSSDVILDQNPRSESPENSQSSVEIPTTQSLENCIVADSQEAEDEETQNYISFCQNLPPEDSIHNVDLIPDNLHLRGNDIALESDEHRASKRQRVMPQLGRV